MFRAKSEHIFHFFHKLSASPCRGESAASKKAEGAIASCVAPPVQFQGFMPCFL